jgi:hypothetical protein
VGPKVVSICLGVEGWVAFCSWFAFLSMRHRVKIDVEVKLLFKIVSDMRPIEQFENDLDRFGKHALPYAVRDTLNTAAYKTSDLAKRNISRKFTERNTFTKRSVRFQKTFARRIDQMESVVGSTQEYMAKQEEGFTQQKTGKHGVAIPTSAAAGQGQARKRTRKLQRRNWLNMIKPPSARVRGRGRTVIAVRDAVTSGSRVVFITKRNDPWRRPTGFYRVLGGRKKGSGWPKGAKLQMIYSAKRPTVRTAPHRWLEPATAVIAKKLDTIYRDAVIRQIKINRSFRDRG